MTETLSTAETVTAAAIMTRDVATVRPDDPVAKIARLLTERGISAVPVCDADGAVLGMISEGDLMRPFGKEHAWRRDWWLNLLSEGHDLAPEFLDYIRVDQRHARDLMAAPAITAPDSMALPELADLLAQHHIKRVPILHDGKLVGIVSRADIIRALAKDAAEAHRAG